MRGHEFCCVRLLTYGNDPTLEVLKCGSLVLLSYLAQHFNLSMIGVLGLNCRLGDTLVGASENLDWI